MIWTALPFSHMLIPSKTLAVLKGNGPFSTSAEVERGTFFFFWPCTLGPMSHPPSLAPSLLPPLFGDVARCCFQHHEARCCSWAREYSLWPLLRGWRFLFVLYYNLTAATHTLLGNAIGILHLNLVSRICCVGVMHLPFSQTCLYMFPFSCCAPDLYSPEGRWG